MKKFILLLTICLTSFFQLRAQGDNPNPPQVSIFGNGQVINCTSDPVRIGVSIQPWESGFVYQWDVGGSDSILDVKPVHTTTYQITVSHPISGFESVKSIMVKVVNEPVLASDASITIDNKTCPGEAIALEVNHNGGHAPFSYTWNTGSTNPTTVVNPNEASSYLVTVMDACGSSSVAEVNVAFEPHEPLQYPGEQVINYDCEEDEVKIKPVTGLADGGVGYGYVFLDDNGNEIEDGLTVKATEDMVVGFTLTDACGIQFKDLNVVLEQRPFETPKPEAITACENAPIKLVETNDQYYFWDGEIMHSDFEIIAKKNSLFELQYIDRCGEQKQAERALVIDEVESDFDFDVEHYERRASLSAREFDEDYNYSWFVDGELVGSNPDLDVALGEADHHEVTLEVENVNGCSHKTTRDVILHDGIRVVSAISPNGDGLNDVFRVEFEDELMLFNIKIFNRWGQLIYESYDQYFEWSGKDNNGKNPFANFVYVLKATTSTGKNIEKTGTLTTIYAQ